ncbi:MAG: AzlD domain-containing protein [Firmicutes bacterium]|nr:AzlD domain-containing protein [Bacillota bacterium]
MNIDWKYALAAIVVVVLVTVFTRALPFIFFGRKKELPETVAYLGMVLPAAIMIILVIFCLRNIGFTAFPYGLPELLAVGIVMIVQFFKKNVFLSIIAGTGLYMILIRLPFFIGA